MIMDNEPNFIRWDDINLDKVAQGYPAELREPFMWLGWFGREQCNRDVEVLTQRAVELNIQHDKTTWSKVLRGRWNKDKDGNVLPSPTVALPKLLRAISVLRENQRLAEMAGQVPFIVTPTAQDIFDFVDVRRSPSRVNRFGIVVGHTGSQKTASFKEFCRRHNHGLCVWMEAPENGGMKEFMTWLGVKYGGGYDDSFERHRRRVFRTVKAANTIFVDNVQALFREERGNNQPVFNFARRLQDERNCTIIFSITPEFNGRLQDKLVQGYFEQFEGRAGGRRNFLVLPDYPPEEDVLVIAKAFGLQDATKHIDYLTAIAHAPGRIRILFEDLQTAKVQAESEKKALTIGHIKEARGEE
jgi:hypothetical protein